MLKGATAQLTLVLEVGLKFAVQGLRVAAHLERKGSCFVVDIDFRNAVCSCSFYHELNFARALHERVEIGSLIYRASNSLCMVSIVRTEAGVYLPTSRDFAESCLYLWGPVQQPGAFPLLR